MQNTGQNKNFVLVIYLILAVVGLSMIIVGSLFQNITIPKEQQDFSHYLNYNFTKPVGTAFFIVAIVLGYFLKVNPLIAGLCMFSVFPLTSLIEIMIDGTSHNLLPFEIAMYIVYALPSIFGLYLGRLIAQRSAKKK